MVSSFLILFREAVEVFLVLGIVLGFLTKGGQVTAKKYAWFGLGFGVIASLVAAWLFSTLVGEFEGPAEQIFEGVAMAVAAALLFPVLSWLSHQGSSTKELTKGMDGKAAAALRWEVLVVVLVSVLRDGVECVLFLGASNLSSPQNNLIGGLLGLAAAALLGWLFFRGSLKVPLKSFFTVTNTFLVFLGAGLAARALGEFGEAGLVPGLITPLWNLNPAPGPDGTLSIWHEDGAVGGFAKAVFGYVGEPSLTQLAGYLAFLTAAFLLLGRKKKAR